MAATAARDDLKSDFESTASLDEVYVPESSLRWTGLELINCGYGRTGTMSLMKALEILYAPYSCYHMVKVMEEKHPPFWLKVSKGKEEYDFEEAFKHGNRKYKATVDFPACTYYKQIHKAYPKAKLMLTVRKDADAWYSSAYDTILQMMPGCPWKPYGFKFVEWLGLDVQKGWAAMHTACIMQDALGATPPSKGNFDKKSLTNAYNRHIADVKDYCKSNNIPLLVYQVSEGWEPLCKYLNKPVPSVPFPNINDKAEFQKYITGINLIGWTILLILIVMNVGLFAIFFYNKDIINLIDAYVSSGGEL